LLDERYFSYSSCWCDCLLLEEERKLIESQIRSNGGNYHPDLSKQCTHLLCATPAGKKYEAALKWSIPCVGVEWLFQSIERGMALEAKYFVLDIEPERRGVGAWDRTALSNLSLTSEGVTGPSFDIVARIDFENGNRKRRLRRAGSKVAQEGIWEGILGVVSDPQAQILPTDNRNIEDKTLEPANSGAEANRAGGIGMDIDDCPRGLFEGMIFYTWGFAEKKVVSRLFILID